MKLLLVRHGRAEDRDEFAEAGQSDAKRPLTPDGIRRMKKAARGLRSLVPSVDLLVTSPLLRAVQTAQTIADAYDGLRCVERNELAPGGDARALVQWLARRPANSVACVVGHEPDLSEFLDLLLADKSDRPGTLKKGSATLVAFDGATAASGGRLEWYHPAKELSSHR